MTSELVVTLTVEELERRIEGAVVRALAHAVPRAPANDGTTLLTIKEAAASLTVSTRTVGRMLSDGRLTPVRHGGRVVRVRQDELHRAGARRH